MWTVLCEVTVIVFNNNFTVLDDQQAIDKLVCSDFIDRLSTTLELDREISDKIIAVIEYQESISICLLYTSDAADE